MRIFVNILFMAGFCGGITANLMGAEYLRPSVPSGIDHSNYEKLLQKYVNPRGMVDYGAWKANSEDMKELRFYLQQFAPDADRNISKNEEVASLINAYNAFTIKTIIENYPVESILKVEAAWTARRHLVGGKRVSLNDIEKGALIPLIGWKVHAAVVCAARSCPPLQTVAYTAGNLDRKIEEGYRMWLSRVDLNRFSSSEKRAEISRIFKWYAKDFEAGGGIKRILRQYAPNRHKSFLSTKNFKIIYIKYRWGLNDQGEMGKDYKGSLLDLLF